MTCFCPNKSVFWISSRLYKKPPQPSESEIASASNGFYLVVKSPLKSNAVKVQHTCTVNIEHDAYRYFFNYTGISSRDSKYTMLIGSIYLDSRGQGKADDFPLKMKAYLRNSPKHFVVQAGKLLQAPKIPLEMVSLTINTKAGSEEYLPT